MNAVKQNNSIATIDLMKFINVLLKRSPIIILVTIVFAGAFWFGSHKLITPKYQASVTLYVNNSKKSEGNSISTADLAASIRLVDTYCAIIKSDAVLEDVIAAVGVDISKGALAGSITAGSVDNTELLKVSVKSADPEAAAKLANGIAEIAPNKIASIVEGSSVKVIDEAKVPTGIVEPSYRKLTMNGALLGFALTCGIIVLITMFDNTVKSREDLDRFGLPILGTIPNLAGKQRSGSKYYGSYGESNR